MINVSIDVTFVDGREGRGIVRKGVERFYIFARIFLVNGWRGDIKGKIDNRMGRLSILATKLRVSLPNSVENCVTRVDSRGLVSKINFPCRRFIFLGKNSESG